MKRKKCHHELRGIHQRALFLQILYVFSWFFANFICIKYSEIGKVFTYWYNAYNFQYSFTHNTIVVLKLLYLWSCKFIIGSSVHLVEVGETFEVSLRDYSEDVVSVCCSWPNKRHQGLEQTFLHTSLWKKGKISYLYYNC